MKFHKKTFSLVTIVCLTIVTTFGVFINPIYAAEKQVERHQSTYNMYWVDKNGKPMNEDESSHLASPRSTFYGTCGTSVLRADGSMVTVSVRPYGWVMWEFRGMVYDSIGDAHDIELTNLNNLTYFMLKKHGSRILTLTGTATDITGKTCSIVEDASIHHSW